MGKRGWYGDVEKVMLKENKSLSLVGDFNDLLCLNQRRKGIIPG